MSNSCSLYPEVNGEISELYKELSKLINDRPTTNLIYAAYLQQGVAADMDFRGKKRNSQNQHSAKDVYEVFEVAKMINEGSDIIKAEKRIGAKDSLGNTVFFTNAKYALEKAQQFNESNTGLVASVVQQGDSFFILIERKDSRTQIRASVVREKQSTWQIIEQAFSRKGMDINAIGDNILTREMVNPIKGIDFINYLKSMVHTRNNILSSRDIAILLLSNINDTNVQRLLRIFGTSNNVEENIKETAQEIYDSYRNTSRFTPGNLALIKATLDRCKKLNKLDLTALIDQINNNSQTLKIDNKEEDIQTTLNDLDKKYGINANEIHLVGDSINSLSQAAANAVVTIQRQLRELESKHGNTTEGKRLENTLNQLLGEIKNKRYYAGCLNFLYEADKQILHIQDLLRSIPSTGTTMEIAAATAKVLIEIKNIESAYYHIIEALSNIDSILTDESISDTDKTILKEKASKIKEFFDREEKKLKDLRKSTMLDICREILGDTLPNGMAIANIVNMAEADSSIWDSLYSIGRASNPLIGAMGKIIRDAQDSRDAKMIEISRRISKADHVLRKAGYDSSFMYGDDGYIISDIDWDSYKKEKKKEEKRLRKSGIKGFDLKDAMDQWEEEHTEERIVDYNSGRTERVPNDKYRKDMPNLTKAQLDYYNTMMQIKGEIGTLLPKYAQKQFLPPQKRRSFLDAVSNAKNVKDVVKAIWNKIEEIWKIREDDNNFSKKGIIDGEEYGITRGALNNTPLRQMPIFFVNKVQKGELMKDFSGALTALASTAINYDAMNEVKDTVEFMGDFIKNQEEQYINNNTKQADAVVGNGIRIFKSLKKWSSNERTADIIDGFISQHIYGVSTKDQGKWAKLFKSLISYTSIKNLSLNLKGMISNLLVGEYNMLIEAGAREFYDLVDYAWAHKKLFGDNTLRAPGKVMDFFTNNKNSYEVLLADLFDAIPGNFDKYSNKRYHHNMFRQMLSSDFTFLGYSSGEYILHYTTMYAVLHNTKVIVDGKKTSLYNAFTKLDKEDGNSELVLKAGVTDLQGNALDSGYLDKIRKRIRYANQSTHGSMNKEDKGIIHQRMLGRAIMNFRQWMVEHYSKRFRSLHYDASLDEWREGFYATTGKLLLGYMQELGLFKKKAALHWGEMNEMQKANVRRAIAEHALIGSLYFLSFALGEPEDHKKEFWYRMWIYQTKRAIVDAEAGTPLGSIKNSLIVINSPMASINTVNGLLYPIYGLGDIDDTIKSGPYKGWNKYGRNILKYTIPFYGQIDQLSRMDEDESVFSIFDSSNMNR
jgi:hypothetical protein